MQSVKVNKEAYQQLASEIAGYVSAIAQAVQSDPRFSTVQSGSESAPTPEWEARKSEIDNLTRLVIKYCHSSIFFVELNCMNSVMWEVVKAVDERQRQDNKWKGRFLGRLRQLRHNASHQGEEGEKVKYFRQRVDNACRSFHVSRSRYHYEMF